MSLSISDRGWSRRLKRTLSGLAAGLLLCTQAQAALVTVSGNTVDFTFDDSAFGIFGAPVVVGDNLVFHPTSFSAAAYNDSGVAFTNATAGFQVAAKDGYYLNSFDLTERGDYLVTGGDIAAVNVQARLLVDALEFNPLLGESADADFGAGFSNTSGFLEDWEGTAEVVLSGSDWASVDFVNVQVENLLTAFAGELLDLAFVEKKFMVVSVGTSTSPPGGDVVVPVPAALPLLFSGLVGLIAIGRRKQSA